MEIPYPVMLKLAVVAAILATAAVADIQQRKIPNWLSITSIAFGLSLSSVVTPWLRATSLEVALAGAGAGFLLSLALYIFGLIGGGDVKLMAALGAFTGPIDILAIAALTFATVGMLGLIAATQHRVLTEALTKLSVRFGASRLIARSGPSRASSPLPNIPVAPAIAFATALHLIADPFSWKGM